MITFRGDLAPERLVGLRSLVGPPVSPAPRDVWDALLREDPYALETQSPAWADAACASGRYEDASRLYETLSGRLLVLPMLRKRGSRGPLAIEAANPLGWGVGGLVAAGGASPAEIAAVFGDLATRRVVSQRLLPNPLFAASWSEGAPERSRASDRVAHIVDLEGGFEHVWSKVHKSSRQGANRAERNGVTVECDTGGRLVAEFAGLLEGAVVRWARLQHEPRWLAQRRHERKDPREKFSAIAAALGERCQVWMARLDGRPVASMMVLRGNNAYDFRAAMDEDAASCRANDLLLRCAIEDACRSGCRSYYMGDSGRSQNLAQFKERFGATPHAYAEYCLERLPISAAERGIKRAVKGAIGFRDAVRVA